MCFYVHYMIYDYQLILNITRSKGKLMSDMKPNNKLS